MRGGKGRATAQMHDICLQIVSGSTALWMLRKKKVSAASRETLASSHGAAYPCFIPRPTGGAVSGEIGLHAPSHELRPRPAFIHGRANVITAE